MVPVFIGVITSVPMSAPGDISDEGPTLTVQMDAQGGTIYLAQLTEVAARNLLLALASWPQLQDFLSELGLGECPRGFAPQRRARLRFPSRVLTPWFMGLSAIFYCPPASAKTLKPAPVDVPTFVRPMCALRSHFPDLSEGRKKASNA
jgi:hypothetical protein